jgi:transcriptional regulator with XRE-family HTH domain
VNELGDKIKTLRKRAHLTLKVLAQKSNISISYLCDIEKGRSNPSLATLESIATALKVAPSSLLYGDLSVVSEDSGLHNLLRIPLLRKVTLQQPLLDPQNIESYFFIGMLDLHNDDCLAFFRVPDDAMIGSRLLRGEMVLVRLGAEVHEGDLALVGFSQKNACIRRVHYLQGQAVFNSGHPGVKPEIMGESGEARILGKVIHAIINFE